MNNRQINRIELKLTKEQQKNFKKKFNRVRSKIRRIKDLSKEDKKVLILDLANVNGDLMDVLYYADQFKDTEDYLDTINAWVRSENDCYKIDIPGYIPSKMEALMEIARLKHNEIDRYDELKSKMLG